LSLSVEEYEKLLAEHGSIAAVARETGRNERSLRRWIKRNIKKVDYEDKRECSENDIDAFYNAMMAMQKAQQQLSTKQVKATIKIEDDKPIGIAWWSDWHEGAVGTDYDLLEHDSQLIRSTDGLYWIGGGDYKDNYISGTHVGANFEQIIQPGMQDIAVKRRMRMMADNCLALVRGCHDDWDKKQGDKDFIDSLCEITDAVNLWHGGDLFINLGSQKYHWKCRHKYPYKSSINVENSMRRIMEMQGPCDVAAEAHLHNPYCLERHLMGDYRYFIRAGSYKVWDEHGQKLAGYKGKPGVPVMIMYPNERKLIGFRELEKGIEVLNALRN
jgi:transposase-like protein